MQTLISEVQVVLRLYFRTQNVGNESEIKEFTFCCAIKVYSVENSEIFKENHKE
jgi:hypothetical protein